MTHDELRTLFTRMADMGFKLGVKIRGSSVSTTARTHTPRVLKI